MLLDMKRLLAGMITLLPAALAFPIDIPAPYSTGSQAPLVVNEPKRTSSPAPLSIPKPNYNVTPGIFIPKQAMNTYMPALTLHTALKNVTMADIPPTGMLPMLYHLMRVSYPIRKALDEAQSASYQVQVSRAEYLPHIDTSMDFGQENRKLPGDTNTNLGTNEEDLTLSQLIYDFGKTTSDINTAHLNYKIALNNFQQAVQSEIINGITTYCTNIRDSKNLVYSIESVKRIGEQYRFEKIKYDRGAGTKADLLEVTSQLTGAKARIITSKASLAKSENNYLAVFHEVPGDFENAKYPRVPRNLIPDNMKDALTVAHHYNTAIKNAEYQLQIASEKITSARSAMFPTISGTLGYTHQYNVSSVEGSLHEYSATLNLSYNLFNGWGDISQLIADHKSRYAAVEQLRQTYLNTDEQIRNAWEEYASANLSYKYLVKQVVELKEFLALTKKERLLGRRSILDILLADINVINAESEANTAHARMIISSYTLLQLMGILDMHMVAEGRPGSPM